MEIIQKKFSQLTLEELYEILKLRIDVFVVEQNCPYGDLDNRDQQAIHVFLQDEDGIEAYLRIMDAGIAMEEVSIGRVIAKKRRCGYATTLLQEGIKIAQEEFHPEVIALEAQVYAKSLYEKVGFEVCSAEFLEDGIPHVKMLLNLKQDKGDRI